MVNGQWSMVNGQWPVKPTPRAARHHLCTGQWSMVNGQWPVKLTPGAARHHLCIRVVIQGTLVVIQGTLVVNQGKNKVTINIIVILYKLLVLQDPASSTTFKIGQAHIIIIRI
jgi:hypothetical protein